MCGIFGIYDFQNQQPIQRSDLKAIGSWLRHRGPDASSYYCETWIGLGINRLRIIDLETGDQPVFNENGQIAAVFNGEIYNYQKLRAMLLNAGHRFVSKGDSEVIPHLYEDWEAAFVSQLNGMFAIALWDQHKQQLLLVRDPLGIKPLYYCIQAGRLFFASEIKALICAEILPRALNLQAVADYLSFHYIPEDQSIFAGIKKLPAGYLLRCTTQGIALQQYWDIPMDNAQDIEPRYLLQILREAVHRHLMSDVPVGATLSGGIDSSAVTALACEAQEHRIKTFSVGFSAPSCDEFGFARLVAKQWHTDHHELVLTSYDYLRAMKWSLWHLDEPIADPNATALALLALLVRKQGVIVLLSGEGSDEIFGGYQYYRDRLRMFRLRHYYHCLSPAARQVIEQLLPGEIDGNKMQRLLFRLQSDRHSDIFRSTTSFFSGQDKRRLLTASVQREVDLDRHINLIEVLMQRDAHPLNRMLYTDTKLWLPADLLAKADKVTMAASVELRVPFLDRELVEMVSRIQPVLKVNHAGDKYILKRALSGLLPPALINRKKVGFPVPVTQWLRGPMKQFAYAHLFGPRLAERDILVSTEIRKLWDAHQTKQVDHGSILWGLLVLELWSQIFLDGSPSVKPYLPDFTIEFREEFTPQSETSRWYLQS